MVQSVLHSDGTAVPLPSNAHYQNFQDRSCEHDVDLKKKTKKKNKTKQKKKTKNKKQNKNMTLILRRYQSALYRRRMNRPRVWACPRNQQRVEEITRNSAKHDNY